MQGWLAWITVESNLGDLIASDDISMMIDSKIKIRNIQDSEIFSEV
jgi:hypothetical protein